MLEDVCIHAMESGTGQHQVQPQARLAVWSCGAELMQIPTVIDHRCSFLPGSVLPTLLWVWLKSLSSIWLSREVPWTWKASSYGPSSVPRGWQSQHSRFLVFFLCFLSLRPAQEEVRSSWGWTGGVKWAGNLMWEAGFPGAVLILHYSKSHFYLHSTSSPPLLWVSHLKIHRMHRGIPRQTWSSGQLEKMVLE